jgi:hypothetical protein
MTRRLALLTVTVALSAFAAPFVRAQAGLSANAQAVSAYVNGQIAAGSMNQGGAEEAIARAYSNGSLSKADFDALTDAIRKQFDQLKKDQQEQNPVFTAEWPFGSVFMGYDYKTSLEVDNGCKDGQTVSVTYPANMFLVGPTSIPVPGKGSVTMPITIHLSELQIPPFQPFVIQLPTCPILSGDIRIEHPQAGRCLAMKRVYSVSMQLHMHPPPGNGNGGGGGGGGGGGKPKPTAKNCAIYWDRGEFFPTKDAPSPESCKDDFRARLTSLVETTIAAKKVAQPGAWDWTPTPGEVAQMSVAQIITLRQRIDAQLGSPFAR